MARINKRSAKILIESVDVSDQLTNFRLTSAETDSDFVTFADAAAGGARDYAVAGTCSQDADADSFWSYMFDAAGDEVDFVYKPYGNATPSLTEPHFTFTAVVKEPDGDLLGGDADASTTAVQATEFEWPLLAKPVKVTT